MDVSLKLLFALLICTAGPSGAKAEKPKAEKLAPSVAEGVFPIVCFLGPPADANRLAHWRRIKKANFTVVLPSYQYQDADQLKMLDYCQQLGLKAVVNVKKLAPPGSSTSPPADWRQRIDESVDRFAGHAALYGYMVRDEPGADLFPQLARVMAQFKSLDPRHIVCINLFPVHASSAQLQTTSYAEYLQRYMESVQPPFLCYDHYPLLQDGSDRPDFFLNLDLARTSAIKHRKPFWTVVLSGWGKFFRQPTAAEMRWQVYGAMAYGVKGIAYFAYWPANDDYSAIVDYSGQPRPLYETVRAINRSVLAIDQVLRRTDSTAVYHTGESLPIGCRQLPEKGQVIELPQQLPLVVGLFQNKTTDERYALIVNRNYRSAVRVPVRVSSDVEDASVVAVAGNESESLNQNQEIVTTLPAGGAVLLRL